MVHVSKYKPVNVCYVFIKCFYCKCQGSQYWHCCDKLAHFQHTTLTTSYGKRYNMQLNFMILRTLIGALYRYLKRCFGCWDCKETIAIKEANWYILTLLRNW